MLSFHHVVQADFAKVNATIVERLHSEVTLVENIGHYLVEAGGKRLRPLLVLLFARAHGYTGQQHIDLAAIIEFIHTATLLHDDVVDMSALRRGRATANAKWGNPPSVLVGDFLYSRAFQMMVAIGNMDIMRVLSDTTNVIAEGEVQQLVNAGNPAITEADYMSVIHKKTAALFEAAAETACLLCGADDEQRAAARRYGYHLGLAFQMVDDYLDYAGDSEAMGKNVGDDLAEGKPTLPLIHAMTHSEETQRGEIQQAIETADTSALERIIEIVRHGGGLDYTRQRANEHAARAKVEIGALPDSNYKQALLELADFSVARSF